MSLDALEKHLEALLSGNRERQGVAYEALAELASRENSADGEAADGSLREALAARVEPLLTHKDAHVRGSSAILLALARRGAALPLLKNMLRDREPGVRCDLSQAAVELETSGKELLEALLTDRVEEVRFAAASGLAGQGDNRGLGVLLDALKRPALRFESFWALNELADPASKEPLRKFFGRWFSNPFDKLGAAGVLARLGDVDARAFILSRIAARKGHDRGLAIELAGALHMTEAIEPLRQRAQEHGDLFQDAAVDALALLEAPAGREQRS